MATTNFYEELLRLVRGFTGQIDPVTQEPVNVTVVVQGPDPNVNPNPQPVIVQNSWKSTVKRLADATTGSGNHVFTVPTGKEWQLLGAGLASLRPQPSVFVRSR